MDDFKTAAPAPETGAAPSAPPAATPPAKPKIRRIGRVAFALLLIAAGVLLLVQQFVPHFDLFSIVRFAPALLIVLGIELLIYSARPDVKVKFDWLGVLGCGFILVIVGCSSLIPVVWSIYGPARDNARNRYQSELQDQFYQALNADTDLKAKVRNLQIYVRFNHTQSDDYTLQDGDYVYVSVTLPENGYADATSFAQDCLRITQLCTDAALPVSDYDFTSDPGNYSNGMSYSLHFLASFANGLTADQLAQRVDTYYQYDGSSYSSQADRDNAAKAELREQIIDEFANEHNGEHPGEEYIAQEVEKRFNELFPAAPKAPAAPEAPATPESAA